MQKKRITSRTQVTKMSVSKYEQAVFQFTHIICEEFDRHMREQSKKTEDSSDNLSAPEPQQSPEKEIPKAYTFSLWVDNSLRKEGLSSNWGTDLTMRITTFCCETFTDHLDMHVELKLQSTKSYFFFSNTPVTDDKRFQSFQLLLKKEKNQRGAHIPKACRTAKRVNEYIFARAYGNPAVQKRITSVVATILENDPKKNRQAFYAQKIFAWKITFYQTLNRVGVFLTHTTTLMVTFTVVHILSLAALFYIGVALLKALPPNWLKTHVQPISKKMTPLSLLAIGGGVISICVIRYKYLNCKKVIDFVIDFFITFLLCCVSKEALTEQLGNFFQSVTTITIDAQSRLGAFTSQTSSHSANELLASNALAIWIATTKHFKEFSAPLELT